MIGMCNMCHLYKELNENRGCSECERKYDIYTGSTADSNMRFLKAPELFYKYVESIQSAVDYIRFNNYQNLVPTHFDNYMKKSGTMSKLIEKHLAAFMYSINTEEQLEQLIYNEMKKILEVEFVADELFEKFKKEACVNSYLSNMLQDKIKEYKDRIDAVEL